MTKYRNLAGIVGVVGSVLAILLLPRIASCLGRTRGEFIVNGTPSLVSKVEIWRNGVNAKEPKFEFSDKSDIELILSFLRSSKPEWINHPQFRERYDLYIHLVDGAKLTFSLGIGGSAGDGVNVYYPGSGGDIHSDEFGSFLREAAIKLDTEGQPVGERDAN
ncbi:hypothetical protein [Coraliomargarita parva]|uniref:hypothetical protein n=1 Tax=Coraliomargarita parva TaxID=3014050 RepID=UPI0022B458CC|nr:hypothetical protein [Coraliomargarita parva]